MVVIELVAHYFWAPSATSALPGDVMGLESQVNNPPGGGETARSSKFGDMSLATTAEQLLVLWKMIVVSVELSLKGLSSIEKYGT